MHEMANQLNDSEEFEMSRRRVNIDILQRVQTSAFKNNKLSGITLEPSQFAPSPNLISSDRPLSATDATSDGGKDISDSAVRNIKSVRIRPQSKAELIKNRTISINQYKTVADALESNKTSLILQENLLRTQKLAKKK